MLKHSTTCTFALKKKMKTFLNTCILAIFMQLPLLAQCIEGNGTINNLSVNTSLIEFVKISAGVNLVDISEGNSQSIELNGDSNILDSLLVESQGDTLIIQFPQDTCFSSYSLNISITTPHIKGLHFLGSGEISIHPFTSTPSLEITNNGSGNIEIDTYQNANIFQVSNYGSGSITMLNNFPQLNIYHIYNYGSGDFYGCVLQTDSCMVSNFGSGFISITAQTYLEAQIFGSGHIEYYGTPSITSTIFGSGDLLIGNTLSCQGTLSVPLSTKNTLQLYPNPTQDVIVLQGEFTKTRGQIYNWMGQNVLNFNLQKTSTIDVSSLKSGSYLIKINGFTNQFIKY